MRGSGGFYLSGYETPEAMPGNFAFSGYDIDRAYADHLIQEDIVNFGNRISEDLPSARQELVDRAPESTQRVNARQIALDTVSAVQNAINLTDFKKALAAAWNPDFINRLHDIEITHPSQPGLVVVGPIYSMSVADAALSFAGSSHKNAIKTPKIWMETWGRLASENTLQLSRWKFFEGAATSVMKDEIKKHRYQKGVQKTPRIYAAQMFLANMELSPLMNHLVQTTVVK